MSKYLTWDEKTITDFSNENINTMYDRGFVFTRPKNGLMKQTRSIRVDLSKFELSSENKRILRKTENLQLITYNLPYKNYHWKIGKMGKDFYEEKFGKGTFSANKIREILTSGGGNFNKLLVYTIDQESGILNLESGGEPTIGYCISRETDEILHYSYPFYILNSKFQIPNVGMGMMLKAIIWAKESGKEYIYLGSAQRPTDTYKLQFKGLEWFDGEKWRENLEELKRIIKN